MIVDHDDELMLNAVEILYSYTENNTIDVIQGRNITINENNELVYATPNTFPQVTIFPEISKLKYDDLWTHLVNTPVALWVCLIKNQFQKEIELGDYVFNDTDFIWKLKIKAKSFCYIPNYIYRQNEHKDSTSGTINNNKNIFDIIQAFYNLEVFLKNESINNMLWKLYTLYGFRMLLGHSSGNLTEENYNKFLNEIQMFILRNPDINDQLPTEYQTYYNDIKNRSKK